MSIYPIRFEPIYKNYVWGGDKIAQAFNRKVSSPIIAESWEVSDRLESMSIVKNGPLKGQSLNDLVITMKEDLLGEGQNFDRFPLLLKIIDAKENLSIQVHPDEQTALKLNGEPKTEAWFFLNDGTILAGLKQGVTREGLEKAIKSKKVDELIEKIDLRRGDVAFIPGGRVHAICEGSFLFEVQQNSNTTYRLYDWHRLDRELHLKEGFDAIHWEDLGHIKQEPQHISSDLHHQFITLVSSPFFILDRIDIFDKHHIGRIEKSFQLFFCIEGSGVISVNDHEEPFEPGMTYLVPAIAEKIDFKGKCEAIRVRLP